MFYPVDEERHGEQVRRTAGTEIACDESLVDLSCAVAPVRATNSARGQKSGRTGLRKAQSVGSASVQQIGVGNICDQRHAGLNANRLFVERCKPPRRVQGGKSDVIDGGKPQAASALAPPAP